MNYGGTSRRNHLASSTSSSLSPLAPPFTVGRGGSSAAPPPYDPYASSWSLGKTSSAAPFDLPPADGAAYFGRGSTSGNLPQAEPYYPRYISPSGSGIQSPDGQRVLLPNTPFNVGVESEASGGSSFWGRGMTAIFVSRFIIFKEIKFILVFFGNCFLKCDLRI